MHIKYILFWSVIEGKKQTSSFRLVHNVFNILSVIGADSMGANASTAKKLWAPKSHPQEFGLLPLHAAKTYSKN